MLRNGLLAVALLLGSACASAPEPSGEPEAPAGDTETAAAQRSRTLPLPDGGELTEHHAEFESAGNTLSAGLVTPEGDGPHPVVVFVHGSGPNPTTPESYYIHYCAPIIEAGAGCFWWDKPGVDESTGTYDEFQSFESRTSEVLAAIEYLRSRPDIDAEHIGLWGISQAAWVMPNPRLIAARPAFIVAVSCPARDVAQQSLHQVRAKLESMGFGEQEIEEATTFYETSWKAETSAEEYAALIESNESKPWMGKVYPNLPEPVRQSMIEAWMPPVDPRPWLEQLDVPVLALFGSADTNIDPRLNQILFEEILGASSPNEVVMVENADHMMLVDGAISPHAVESVTRWVSARLQ